MLARTLLVATLLPQLGILWVLHRPSPTRLPAALVTAATDRLLGEATAEVARATVDRRGEIRLEGLRIADPSSGAVFTGEARVTPPWSSWLSWRRDPPRLEARGRLVAPTPEGEAIADDLRVSAGDPDGAWLDIAARAGKARLRVESRTMALIPRVAGVDGGGTPDWRRLLLEVSRLEGGAELRLRDGLWSVDLALRGDAARTGAWRIGAAECWLTKDGSDLIGWARLADCGFGETEVGVLRAHVLVSAVTATLEGGRWGALRDVAGTGTFARTRAGDIARLALTAGGSRVRARLTDPRGPEGWRMDRVAGILRSSEIVRLPGVAEALRRAEIDVAGSIELGDGTVELMAGEPVAAEAWFAVRNAGWKAIRPSIIRPDRPEAALTGRARVELAKGAFAASDLDLAGLVGSIEGGLSAGDGYVVRLASTPGNPVYPGCLDSLLGDWWIDLWRRFDLSTSGSYPHADVVVKGKWGASVADRVEVDAVLERFGFMGARFRDTAVRVEASPDSTLVRIDRLTGELEGQAAGSARGTVAWDWSSGVTTPRIVAEGDLHPLVALRLREGGADQAARLRGAVFGQHHLKVEIAPTGATTVNLTTRGDSEILGARLGPMAIDLAVDPAKPGSTRVTGAATLADGRCTFDLDGDLGGKTQVRAFEAKGVSWSRLPKALPFLFENPGRDNNSEAVLSGRFTGVLDLDTTPAIEGEGDFRFEDPQLRRVQLFGVLSQGLDALGLGFSGYDLTEATGEFRIKDQMATLPRLLIGGEDAELRLAGQVDLATGGLNLAGDFELKDSRWGPLGFLNPNRLITKVIKIKVGGTLAKPETKVEAGF